MKFYAGTTDLKWYNFLKGISPDDVNFWRPGNLSFKYLSPGAPFLFKLKRPFHCIGGLGFFLKYTSLPLNVAWDVFGIKNGCASYQEFQNLILNYRADKSTKNPTIGCIVLANPIFFEKEDWIDLDGYVSKTGITSGKGFDASAELGNIIWNKLNILLKKYLSNRVDEKTENQLTKVEEHWPGYKHSILNKVRIGQAAFRILITDAYSRRCSISGEKTLPVLEASHIKPYSYEGPHTISNGILLRSDIHKLFDDAYITITKDFKIEVSKAIKEEFENGREYYQFHGKSLLYLPKNKSDKPNEAYIEWHNSKFRG